MKVGDRVIGSVTTQATIQGNPSTITLKPEGPIVDISGDNAEFLHVYTQYGGVWRIPAGDCTLADGQL